MNVHVPQAGFQQKPKLEETVTAEAVTARTIADSSVQMPAAGDDCGFAKVQSSLDPAAQYQVNTSLVDEAGCGCMKGLQGNLCKHRIKAPTLLVRGSATSTPNGGATREQHIVCRSAWLPLLLCPASR